MRDAVLVTGLGAVSSLGPDAGALWQRALRGERGAAALDLFDPARHRTDLAAQVTASDWPAPFRRMARADRFGCTATAEATAGIDPALLRTRRCGVFFGSSTGALFEGERFLQQLLQQHEGDLHTIVGLQNDGPGNAVAHAFGVGGPVMTFSTACTSANVAIGAALDALQSGEVDVALAGGADELCEITYAGFNSLRAIDKAPTRPFRRDRQGLLLGEGSGVLLLETAAHAAARGAAAIAELVSAGRSCDAQHVSAPDPTGAGAAAAIRTALREAGLAADDVTFVNAHGTGTPHNDTAEAAALRVVFGERTARLPVTSTKSMVGHLLGAAGGVEAVLTALSIRDRLLPPTAGEQPADPELGLDVVLHGARALPEHNVGLSTNLAFGGNNAVILLRSLR
ncbi:MAG: beta-ketoacyl-[acyl-carrier-protein] synthase family protein [Planctomycetes bacterium]|nr:beta-ketoacyl-[acyl-carrier-protein] synthase family protein [Planctomycetota bacterium]